MTNYSIVIDNREAKLKDHFKDKENIQFENLDICDIVFKLNNNIVFIIEMKTVNDLYCSIKDGRYKEQKNRLLSNYTKDKVLYLIENDIDLGKHKFNLDIVYGSIVNTLLRDKIRILKSKNINETIKYIEILIKRLQNNMEYFTETNETHNKDTQLEYANTIKLEKKKNMTPELCQIIQLAQIPGMSINSAKSVLEQYENKLKNIIITYENLDDEESTELLLSDIEIKASKEDKKSKKLGKVLSKRVYEYLN